MAMKGEPKHGGSGGGELEKRVTAVETRVTVIEKTMVTADVFQREFAAFRDAVRLAIGGLQEQIGRLRDEMRVGFGELRTQMQAQDGALRAEVGGLRDEMHVGFGELRTEMQAQHGALRTEMRAMDGAPSQRVADFRGLKDHFCAPDAEAALGVEP